MTLLTSRPGRVAALLVYVISGVLAVPAVFGSPAFDSFATVANVGNIATSSSFLAIIAIGMTFFIISGGIDLSVGSLFVLGGVLAAYGSQYGFLVALALPLAVSGLFGLVHGLIIARTGMAPFIVTLAGLLGARGLMLAVSDEGAATYLAEDPSFALLGQGSVLNVGYPVFAAAVLLGAGMVLLRRTGFGQNVYAIGGTPLTGGAGALGGTIAGALLLGVIQNLINPVGNLNASFQQVVSGLFLALVVIAHRFLGRVRKTE
ncbi:ABC transporter permease [Streptosporangium sp. NPDC023963]|uniref:ABC transporter permease n=1 Tax=Streptosporangium sp. NPDC023963 TaxID=3155608 RepID=UPI0034134F38